MSENHFGSGIPHNIFNFLSHFRFIAMDSTIGAYGFIVLKRAVQQALRGIFVQIFAFLTKDTVCHMFSVTVNSNHFVYSFLFQFNPIRIRYLSFFFQNLLST